MITEEIMTSLGLVLAGVNISLFIIVALLFYLDKIRKI